MDWILLSAHLKISTDLWSCDSEEDSFVDFVHLFHPNRKFRSEYSHSHEGVSLSGGLRAVTHFLPVCVLGQGVENSLSDPILQEIHWALI